MGAAADGFIRKNRLAIGIYAGPNFSKYSTDQDSLESKARVGYQLLGPVTLDVSYHHGIKDVYKAEKAKLRMVSASLGFKF